MCGSKTSNLCVILFLEDAKRQEEFTELLHAFKNDPVTLTYVLSSEEPGLVTQFGVRSGVIIYKPKRAKFVRLDEPPSPAAVKNLVDNTLGGGGQDAWNKMEERELQFS